MLNYELNAAGLKLTDNEENFVGEILNNSKGWYVCMVTDGPADAGFAFQNLEAAKYAALAHHLESP